MLTGVTPMVSDQPYGLVLRLILEVGKHMHVMVVSIHARLCVATSDVFGIKQQVGIGRCMMRCRCFASRLEATLS
jgi:hypothetical protein